MKKIPYILVLAAMILSPITPVLANEFNNGNIISDIEAQSASSMTLAQINEFLNTKSGTLNNFVAQDKNGLLKPAAEIIWQAAQDYNISPKFLLVMLQKEQSVVEDSTPTQKQYDWAMGYAVCDSCDPDDPALALFRGFGTQVDKAAWRFSWYYNNANNGWLKKSGQTYKIDGQIIFMENQATANLYNYTPHIKGNYNYWKIWNSWFIQDYPDGSLLKVDKQADIWLIENGAKRKFVSKSALISRYDVKKVITVSQKELDKYEVGTPIKFPNYSLLLAPSGNVYLIVDNKVRKFENKEVLRTLGFNPEEFIKATKEDVNMFDLGELITLKSSYPSGALLQNNKTGGVYFVQDGNKSPILTKEVMKVNYPAYKIIRVSPEELSKYTLIETAKLRDGEIVSATDSNSVYIISNGTKRPIASGEVFENLGYKWSNVREVDPKTLSNIPLGSYIEMEFKK